MSDALKVNRVFHDHECLYYDERFGIVHDDRSARQALREVEHNLGRSLRDGEVVLDAGCGTGWLALGLRRARPDLVVIGTDLSTGMLDQARRAGAWPLLQADSQRLPLHDGAVDVVVTRGVLHHLPDVPRALTEWRRVLKPAGEVVVISEPTPTVEQHGAILVRVLLAVLRRPLTAEEDFWEVASMAANLHVFTEESLAGQARQAGFQHVRLGRRSFTETMLLTMSYVTHGRRPTLARMLPWRTLVEVTRSLDGVLFNRVLPSGMRHVIDGVLVAPG